MSIIPHTDKDKLRPVTGHERPEMEQRYSSSLSLTSAPGGDGWLTPREAGLRGLCARTHCTGDWVRGTTGLDG